MHYTSDYLHILHERGFIQDITDATALDEKMRDSKIAAYIGFDCTAPSLHVGSLVQIMMLAWLQKTGHKPLIVMGGGTTKIGDPSGKDESRKLLDDATIADNMEGIKNIFKPFLAFGEGASDAVMINNDDWLSGLSYIAFLRDFGRHFSVNRMLSFESVKSRLEREQNLSFLEFNYMVLQAYDFVELYKRYDCVLQMGGSDQWGNIVSGIDLGRRICDASLFGLTTPLLTTASGAKMGKTASGAVWLNKDMLSDWEYWQFWRNVADADVVRFLKLFTFLPTEEIAKLAALQGAELNEAKKILATEATALARGRDIASEMQNTAERAFEQGESAGLPETLLAKAEFDKGLTLLDILVTIGLAPSKSEARRLIKGGGVKINDASIQDDKIVISDDHMQENAVKLSVGKKKHHMLRIS
ncbi:MAG: tyrosine--tRNA ligase [Pseudomonadota bacterium]